MSLQEPGVPARLARAFAASAVPGAAAHWWTAWRVGVLAAAVAGFVLAGLGAAALLAAVAVAGPVAALHLTRGRADALVERSLPPLLEDAARKLRAGTSLAGALAAAGGELASLRGALERGDTLAAALGAWARARPLPGVQLAAAALRLAAEQGGAQARAIDGVAATLRERLDRAAELRAATAQARASVAVLGVAPVAFALVSFLIDPRTARAALASPAGLVSITAGLALDGIAIAWMSRLMRLP